MQYPTRILNWMKDPQHSHLKYSIIQHIRTQEPLNEVSNVKSTDTIPETLLNADQSFLSLKKTIFIFVQSAKIRRFRSHFSSNNSKNTNCKDMFHWLELITEMLRFAQIFNVKKAITLFLYWHYTVSSWP